MKSYIKIDRLFKYILIMPYQLSYWIYIVSYNRHQLFDIAKVLVLIAIVSNDT